MKLTIATIHLITWKILVGDMESCYKNIFKFHTVEKLDKIHMDSEKSINSFEIKRSPAYL